MPVWLGNTATIALMRHDGSHLIRPIVDQLGFTIVEPGKFGAPKAQAVGPVVVWLRDPRNRMVSTLRWRFDKPKYADRLKRFDGNHDLELVWLLGDQKFMSEMVRWARTWMRWDGALRVKFEDFKSDGPAQIARIAAHLGCAVDPVRDERLYQEIWEHSRTYTGSHSVWQEWFGPQTKQFWREHGGDELVHLMGYRQ
jgi:hypothetical protein